MADLIAQDAFHEGGRFHIAMLGKRGAVEGGESRLAISKVRLMTLK